MASQFRNIVVVKTICVTTMWDNHQKHDGSILYESIMDLMPQFVLHIDPIVHSSRFRGMRINDNQVKVLMMLYHAGKVSPGFITHHLNIQKGSLTGVLRSLRRKELIVREDVEGDERSYCVALSKLGKEFIVHHITECRKETGMLFDEMKEADQHQVKQGLETLIRYLKTRGGSDA